MRPIHYYMFGTGSWFLAFGIQGVMFAWLVTMVLRESPEMVGLAQMTLLLPAMLFMLVGGSYADRLGGRRMAIIAQLASVVAPLMLLVVVWLEQLTLSSMLLYAVMMGCAVAFVTPARDGLLNHVAEGRIQRTVLLTSVIQFSMQMLGFLIASLADGVGPVVILGVQAGVLAIGVFGFMRVPATTPQPLEDRPSLVQSVIEGSKTVLRHPEMRMVMLQNFAMGLFFMGSFIVTLPLLVRDVFDGSATDLGLMNATNSIGLVVTILLLLRMGDVQRQGRALILAQLVGSVVLAVAAMAASFAWFVATLFFWGACGGIAMTMSRTIMQEQAPDAQRGRVMGFYSFSFMGGGPIGALLSGYLVREFGPQMALTISASIMFVFILMVGLRSSLWRMKNEPVLANA
ncbi:MAG: MFS transporter [Gammaproteobacteria bacterium]|nr:MFS transporter [Gammaproteobacteria bacterium]